MCEGQNGVQLLPALNSTSGPHTKDSGELVPIQQKIRRMVVQSEATTYEQWRERLRSVWRSPGGHESCFHKEEEFKRVLCGSTG